MEASQQRPARPSAPPVPSTSTGATGPRSAVDNHTKVKELYDEAYLYIDQGLTCDEHSQLDQALTLYTKGLRCIDQAMYLANFLSDADTDARSLKTRKLLNKMNKTRISISARTDELISGSAGRMISDPPPSYEVATTPTETPQSGFDAALADSIMADAVSDTERELVGVDASVLFSIREGVQMFFITPEGYVSAPSYPSSLTVYRFTDPGDGPPAFLTVGEWTYPLLPGRSPVLHADWGAYIFPDVNAVEEGSTVGVIIPDTVSAEDRTKMEQLLTTMTNLRIQTPLEAERPALPVPAEPSVGEDWEIPEVRQPPPRPPPPHPERTSEKISSGIVTAAEWLSWGLVKGAHHTGRLVKYGSSKLKQKIQPELEKPDIDPRVKQGVYIAKEASHVVVKVSGFLVDNLGKATMAIGRQVAPHIKKHGEKYLPKSLTTKEQDGASKMDGVITVAAGGIQGWATVYEGLEQAAKVLAVNIKKETVNVVGHKYGSEAGAVAGDTLQSAFNIGYSAHNFSNLGAKAIAKRAAKDTGKAYVQVEAERTTSGGQAGQGTSQGQRTSQGQGSSQGHSSQQGQRGNENGSNVYPPLPGK